MNLNDLFSSEDTIQDIYCGECSTHMDLAFLNFDKNVSGVRITVDELPTLVCPNCNSTSLPDRSRYALIHLHKRALDENRPHVISRRKKTEENYGFTDVPFQYDSDDYIYIPGLERTFGKGYLTPIFFNKEVLLKYDAHPSYKVAFASRTYGSIIQNGDLQVPFGINRNGRLVMWLGDISQLSIKEQYYLCSENVESDHSIGSEFYDGQIECIFTNRTPEDQLFRQRSKLLESCFNRFGHKIAHLENEVLDVAISIRPPLVDTPSERRNMADALNKVYIESFNNKVLENILDEKNINTANLGSLKRLQKLAEVTNPAVDVAKMMNSLYVLYDLRVAYSHLGSKSGQYKKLLSVKQRLNLSEDANLLDIYTSLLRELKIAFKELAAVFS